MSVGPYFIINVSTLFFSQAKDDFSSVVTFFNRDHIVTINSIKNMPPRASKVASNAYKQVHSSKFTFAAKKSTRIMLFAYRLNDEWVFVYKHGSVGVHHHLMYVNTANNTVNNYYYYGRETTAEIISQRIRSAKNKNDVLAISKEEW